MKKLLLLGVLLMCSIQIVNAQISYSGCESAIPAGYPYTLNSVDTTNDGGIIRNTFISALPGASCGAGVCAFRIIWNISNSRWEIALSNDGGTTFPSNQLLYYNIEASQPNPPSLNLGTWIDNLGGACGGDGSISVLTGDVQDNNILSVSDQTQLEKDIKVFPNPVNHTLHIDSNIHILKSVIVYSLIGKEVLHLSSGFETIDVSNLSSNMYFLMIETKEGAVLNKKLLKK